MKDNFIAEINEDEEDLILLKLKSNDVKICYSQLCKYSQLIRSYYLNSDIKYQLSGNIQNFQTESNIKEENIIYFFQILQGEHLEITNDNYRDIFKLSEFFQVKSLLQNLDKYSEMHFNDVNFMIHLLLNDSSSSNNFGDLNSEFSTKIQNLLINRIEECIQDKDFPKLPASIIYRMIDKSDRERIVSDDLFKLVDKSIEKLCILFQFLDLEKLSERNIQKLLNDFCKSQEETTKKYYQYLSINLPYVISLRNKNNELQNQINQMKKQFKARFSQKIEENLQLKSKIIGVEEENREINKKLNESELESRQLIQEKMNLIKEVQIKCNQLDVVNTSLKSKIIEVEEENRKLNENELESQKLIQEKINQIKEVRIKCNQLDVENTSLKSKIIEIEEDRCQTIQKLNEIERENNDFKDMNSQLSNQVNQINNECKIKQKQLTEENDCLKIEICELEAKNKQLLDKMSSNQENNYDNISYDQENIQKPNDTKEGNADSESFNKIGILYKNGKGVKQDYLKAFEYFQKSAELGNSSGMNNLGLLYRDGRGIKQDYLKAFEYFQKSAELEDPDGLCNLGFCYHLGQGVEQNYYKAFECYEKSSKFDNSHAFYNLGSLYIYGKGTEKNLFMALKCYEKSVELGNPIGMSNLGCLYRDGIGVEQNYKKAFEFFEKSAEFGNSYGMCNLGYCYEEGLGVEQDKEKAIEYYKKSAELGNNSAVIKLQNMNI